MLARRHAPKLFATWPSRSALCTGNRRGRCKALMRLSRGGRAPSPSTVLAALLSETRSRQLQPASAWAPVHRRATVWRAYRVN